MRVALDTNRYVALCKGIEETVSIVATAEAVFLPFVVAAELRAGFAMGRRPAENERVLRHFLLKNGVSVLYPDDGTTHRYAAVFRQLRTQWTPIPAHDLWIAALALQHDLLLTRDRRHLPQIVRSLNPPPRLSSVPSARRPHALARIPDRFLVLCTPPRPTRCGWQVPALAARLPRWGSRAMLAPFADLTGQPMGRRVARRMQRSFVSRRARRDEPPLRHGSPAATRLRRNSGRRASRARGRRGAGQPGSRLYVTTS
jgi:predicted nucleic acid-binding protein